MVDTFLDHWVEDMQRHCVEAIQTIRERWRTQPPPSLTVVSGILDDCGFTEKLHYLSDYNDRVYKVLNPGQDSDFIQYAEETEKSVKITFWRWLEYYWRRPRWEWNTKEVVEKLFDRCAIYHILDSCENALAKR